MILFCLEIFTDSLLIKYSQHFFFSERLQAEIRSPSTNNSIGHESNNNFARFMPTIKTRLIATHSGDDIGAKVSSEVSIHSFHPSRRGVTNLGHGAARYALFSIPRFPRESLATRHSRSVLQQAFVSITTTIYPVSRSHAHVYVCSIAAYSRDHQPTVWRSQWTSYGLNALPHQLIVLFALVFRDARTSYHEIPIFRSAISDRRIFTH